MVLSAEECLARCHHPLVRDLAWLLLAPDLIVTPCPGRPSRGELGLGDDDRLAAWLKTLEVAPERLEAFLAPALTGRMGLYHERLWQFLLDTAPNTRLLAHNLRIHQGKRTLGELDLLYCRRDDPRPVHLEVAIKFYLGLPQGPGEPDSQARWIGPGGADSLAVKREHLHRHQLRLTASPEARETLAPWWSPPSSVQEGSVFEQEGSMPSMTVRLAIPGVLFHPWHAPLPPPCEAATDYLRGQWVTAGDWPRLRDGLPPGTLGARLNKPHWLAPPRREALLSLRDLDAQLVQHLNVSDAPVQLALWQEEKGWQRLFVVADDWPRQVPLPPYQRPRHCHHVQVP